MTPLDIISRALRAVGAVASGDPVDPQVAADSFDLLNDMLDMWSTQSQMVFCINEVIHELTSGQYVYSIGTGGQVGGIFAGSINDDTLIVTSVSSGALFVGMLVTGTGVADGTYITSLQTGQGGNGTAALGSYKVSGSQTVVAMTFTGYAPRPVRLRSAIVRVVNAISGTLDYPVAVLNLEQYERIGIKTLPHPWPRAVYYQPSEPLGVLNYWGNPQQQSEVHLFCDQPIFQFQSLSQDIVLPQGYALALRYSLGELLIPEYPVASGASAEMRALIPKYAKDARGMLKSLNAVPQQPASFDDVITAKAGRDAGWILHGGFN